MSDDMKSIAIEIFRCVIMFIATVVLIMALGSIMVYADESEPITEQFYDDPAEYYEDMGLGEYEGEPMDAFAVAMNPERDYLIVVNDDHEYIFSSDYDMALKQDIIYLSDCYGELTPIEKGAGAALSLLKQHLSDQGIEIQLFSAYRTREDQQWVYDYYGNLEDWSETNKVAKPGFSEHHTGLLVNIVAMWPWVDDWATETPEHHEIDPDFFDMIHASLADYGFIDRYPEGKEDITGYPSEPYEIRFVGSSKIAHEIMDNGLCLEEYLAMHQAG